MTIAIRDETAFWRKGCREVAMELVEDSGLSGPPVDAWLVARALRLRVAFDAGQAGRGRLKRIAGRTAILLRPEERPEREQWTLAHEIGEAVAHRVFERLGVDPQDADPRQREQVANALASSLLLPDDWLARDAAAVDGDVLQLKQIYTTASHELILFNLLKLPQLTLASIFDHGRLTRRGGNGQLAAPPLLPLERCIWRAVHESGEPAEGIAAGVRVQGWPVIEPGWNRELLRTTAIEGIDGCGSEDDDGYAGDDHETEYELARAD